MARHHASSNRHRHQPCLSSPAGGFSAGVFRSLFPFALPQKRGARLRLQKRKRSAVMAHISIGVLRREHAPALRRPVSPYGAPLRRLKTLGPHSSENRHPGRRCASRGGFRTVTLGSVVSRGAIVQGLPGARLRDRARGHRFPLTFSFASRTFLRRAGTGAL